jgi:predicted  nucleic acid-binding Zn-ribbon protein
MTVKENNIKSLREIADSINAEIEKNEARAKDSQRYVDHWQEQHTAATGRYDATVRSVETARQKHEDFRIYLNTLPDKGTPAHQQKLRELQRQLELANGDSRAALENKESIEAELSKLASELQAFNDKRQELIRQRDGINDEIGHLLNAPSSFASSST